MVSEEDRVRFQIDPDLFAKAQKKTGLQGKSEVFEALLKMAGTNGTDIQLPDNLKDLGPEYVTAMVKEGQRVRSWKEMKQMADARKAVAQAVKAELEVWRIVEKDKVKSYTPIGLPEIKCGYCKEPIPHQLGDCPRGSGFV